MACVRAESDCAAASGNWNSWANAIGPTSQTRAMMTPVRIETRVTINTQLLTAQVLAERIASWLDDYEACEVNRKVAGQRKGAAGNPVGDGIGERRINHFLRPAG